MTIVNLCCVLGFLLHLLGSYIQARAKQKGYRMRQYLQARKWHMVYSAIATLLLMLMLPDVYAFFDLSTKENGIKLVAALIGYAGANIVSKVTETALSRIGINQPKDESQ